MKLLVPLVVVAMAVAFGFKCAAVRKDLTAERQAIDADWLRVDAALTHRSGVVPELTGAFQSAAPAETAAIGAVNDARNQLDAAQSRRARIEANTRLDQAIARLLVLVENYPKFESSRKYADLLETMKAADYQIAVERRRYNEAVEHYNARLDGFPENLVSSVSRLGKIDAYFQTAAP